MAPDNPEQSEVAVSDWAGERGKKWVENLAPTERMLAPVDEPLLAALSLEGALRIADIGCGGGSTTRAIARAADPQALVQGIDISPDVIAAAQIATQALGPASRVSFRCVDAATTAPDEGGVFDRLSSRFGVMFFDDPEKAFANLAGWLAPGGQFAFAVWGALRENPWMLCLRDTIAELIELPPPVPDAPGPFRYADAARFCSLLSRSGFADVKASPWRGEVVFGGGLNATEAAAFAVSAFSVGGLLQDDPALLAEAQQRLAQRYGEYEQQGQVLMPAAVHIVTGRSGVSENSAA